MRPSLAPTLHHQATLEIVDDLTVPHVSPHLSAFSDMPPVFATAFMVGLIEAACIECVRDHLDQGEHTVGTHVDVRHTAATPAGLTVTAKVELTDVRDRALRFRVVVLDDAGAIGGGTHERAVIDVARFTQKVEARAAAPHGTGESG